MASIVTTTAKLVAAGVGLLYGSLYLAVAFVYAVQQEEYWSTPDEESEVRLDKASRELWSLSDEAGPFSHNFLKLESGTQLHYLSPRNSLANADTLVVFVHGFPDSAHLFSRQLRSSLSQHAKLVALDLPGCGGSDDLSWYGPEQVLNTVCEAIDQLKRRYLTSSSKHRCILVGHDWGGVVAFRIAAETEGLVDHVVTMNSLYPAYAEETLKAHISRGSHLLSKWRMREAARELAPVLSQMRKSGYTYMLTLPFPIAKYMPRTAACLVKYIHSVQYKESAEASSELRATQLSKAYGPSAAECSDGPSYGKSVLARSSTYPPGDWDQKVRLYSEGLLRDKWKPSSQVKGSASQGDGPQTFKCPVHIIFGLKDVALDPRIVLDGIEKYFQVQDSRDALAEATHARERIVRLPDCGHWSILEDGGVRALDTVLQRIM